MADIRKYIALVVQEEADASFWIHFPDFRYCFTCGITIDEAEKNAADALATHIDGLVNDGYTVPQPTPRHMILADTDMNIVSVLEVPAAIPPQARTNNISRIEPRRTKNNSYDP